MENAAEALKIAAWVLIFVVALSMCINSFSQARQTMDVILEYNDKEYSYTYIEDNGSTERIISCESIIPAIYRAYKENYKIIFPENYILYTKKDTGKQINYIDLEKETLGNEEAIEEFIKGVLFGKQSVKDSMLKNSFYNINFKDTNDALYNKIEGRKFKEKLGVYYQNETETTPDTNKIKKRVITYEEI